MLTSLVTKAQWPSLYSLGVFSELPLGGFGWKYHAIGHEVDVTSAVPLHPWCLGRSCAVNCFLAGKALEVCWLLDSQWREEGVSTTVLGRPRRTRVGRDKGVGLRHSHTQDQQESCFNSWFPRSCLEVQLQ